jgi:hypothetical protein
MTVFERKRLEHLRRAKETERRERRIEKQTRRTSKSCPREQGGAAGAVMLSEGNRG